MFIYLGDTLPVGGIVSSNMVAWPTPKPLTKFNPILSTSGDSAGCPYFESSVYITVYVISTVESVWAIGAPVMAALEGFL